MATAPSGSGNTSATNVFAGDPFCTRGLRDALERLERQIGRIGELATEKDVSAPSDFEADQTPAAEEVNAALALEPPSTAVAQEPLQSAQISKADRDVQIAQIQAEFTAELHSANARCAAAEERAHLLERNASVSSARADELAQQVAKLEQQLQQHAAAARAPESSSAPSEADLQKQITTMQAELRLIRKERDQLMTRLQREESRLQKAGISIEWDKPAAKPKAIKTKRRSSG